MEFDIPSYSCRHVRNLIWLLTSPTPLAEEFDDFRLLPNVITQRMAASNEGLFRIWDSGVLEEMVSTIPTHRLGIYAEYLLAFFFQNAPNIELYTHSFQIIRDKQTLGEMDYIVGFEGVSYHIELAVKYYLGHEPAYEFEHWIGPSGQDKLSDKLDKVLMHQLEIVHEPEVKLAFPDLNLSSHFLCKGLFFFNRFQLPNWINRNAELGEFYTLKEFNAQPSLVRACYVVLERPHWMSDLVVDSSHYLPVEELGLDVLVAQNGAVLVKRQDGKKMFINSRSLI
jgi:hypothetical protein